MLGENARKAIKSIRDGNIPSSISSAFGAKLSFAFFDLAISLNELARVRGSGFNGLFDFSESSISDANKAVEETRNALRSVGVAGFSTAFDFYAKRYSTYFSSVTEPQLATAVNAIGGYYGVLTESMVEQERLSQQYREMGLSTLGNIGSILIGDVVLGQTGRAIVRSATKSGIGLASRQLGVSLARSSAAAVLSAARGTLLRGVARAVIGRLAAMGAGLAINPALGLAITAGLIIWEGWNFIRNLSKQKALVEMAQNKALVSFFNPKKLTSVYQANAALLGEDLTRFNETGGLERLVGTGLETSSWSSRVYNSAMTGNYSEASSGIDLMAFGIDVERVLSTASSMSRNVQTGANSDIVANILANSALFTGGDPSLMEDITKNIIRSNAYTEKDVTDATERFEEFFAAVVGDGVPQAAHLNLISALSSFSYDYALGTKANLGATTEIAKVQQFMGDNGMINGRFDTAATQSVVTSLDDFLLRGATFQDLNASQIVSSMGITREEALKGITYDANTLDKALGGIISAMNVSYEDILNDTPKFNRALQNFARMGNFSNESLNPLMVALRRYAEGDRVEDIRVQYKENLDSSLSSLLPPEGAVGEGIDSVFEITSNIVSSQNTMLDTVRLNLDVVSTINDIIMDISNRGFGNISEGYLETLRTILGLPKDFVSSSSSGTSAQGSSAGTSSTEAGSASTGASTNFSVVPTPQGPIPPAIRGTDEEKAALERMVKSGGEYATEFDNLHERTRDVLSLIFSYSAGNSTARVTDLPGERPTNEHRGFDYVIGPAGSESPIHFPFNQGTVVSAGSLGSYGNAVVIKLPNGPGGYSYDVYFTHLSSVNVSEGQEIGFDYQIGTQGNTGVSTATHIHFELRRSDGQLISDPNSMATALRGYLPGYATGGLTFPDRRTSSAKPSSFLSGNYIGNIKNIYLTVPLSSKNPARAASIFREKMNSLLS